MLNFTPQRSDILHLLRRIPQQQTASHLEDCWKQRDTYIGTDTPVVTTIEHSQLLIRTVTE